jgi:hypothetical protein
MMGGDGDDIRGYKGDVATVWTVISPTAESLPCAYFASINWPLNKVLPKGGGVAVQWLGGYHEGSWSGENPSIPPTAEL